MGLNGLFDGGPAVCEVGPEGIEPEKARRMQPAIGAAPAPAGGLQYIHKLRILSIYAVVTGHVTIWMTQGAKPFSFNWWFGCWVFFLCVCSIPVFVMVSGALLLDDRRREPAVEFYQRRLYRVGIPLVFWSVVYLAVRKFVYHEQLTAGSVAGLVLGANVYYHLWFLYMIPGLYLITPFLRRFVRNSSRGQRISVIVAILVLGGICSQLNILYWGNGRTIFTVFIPYIAYYLCGYELLQIDPRKIPTKYLAVAAAACALYIAAFSGVFIERRGGVDANFIFGFFSLPVAVMSIAVFWAAYLHSKTAKIWKGIPRTALQWVASTTLGIYLLHPILLEYMRNRLAGHVSDGTFLLGIVAAPLVTFVACYLLTSLMMNIPLLRRTCAEPSAEHGEQKETSVRRARFVSYFTRVSPCGEVSRRSEGRLAGA